jgi:putative molybdopterin biosynthesis protein
MAMEPLNHLHDAEHFGVLGHPQRLALLRQLMGGPATLSQLARRLDSYPAQIRHHLMQLERAGLVTLTETRQVRGFVEKYYQATSRAIYVNLAIVPAAARGPALLLMGSDDPALAAAARQLSEDGDGPELTAVAVGSLEGLIALHLGACQLAGCHLLDAASGEYNRAHVGHLFPGRQMTLVTLAHRTQGLLLPPGNPRRIRSVADLAQPAVTFINRQPGSGTRIWLDGELGRLGLSGESVAGYERSVNTHREVGRAVASGLAGAGVGVMAVAQELGLAFVPLFEERYDLVFQTQAAEGELRALLEHMQTAAFRSRVAYFAGYDSRHSGEAWSLSC